MRRVFLCLLGLNVVLVPCYADVIPSSYDCKDAKAKETVKARLRDLGLNATAADERVQRLSQAELTYFSGNPDRIQAAGGLYWYEWVFSAVMIGAAAAYVGHGIYRRNWVPVER